MSFSNLTSHQHSSHVSNCLTNSSTWMSNSLLKFNLFRIKLLPISRPYKSLPHLNRGLIPFSDYFLYFSQNSRSHSLSSTHSINTYMLSLQNLLSLNPSHHFHSSTSLSSLAYIIIITSYLMPLLPFFLDHLQPILNTSADDHF